MIERAKKILYIIKCKWLNNAWKCKQAIIIKHSPTWRCSSSSQHSPIYSHLHTALLHPSDLAEPTQGVQHTILTFWTPSCNTKTWNLLVLCFLLVLHELLSCEGLLLVQLSWALTLWEKARRLFFFIPWQSEQETTSTGSILTRPDRINLTSSHSQSLNGRDGGHHVAVKSSTPWSTVTPYSSGLWVCTFECVQVKLEKALMCLRALSWHMCVHRSVHSCKAEAIGCVLCAFCAFLSMFLMFMYVLMLFGGH